jgi:hypothetical protein
MRHPHATMEALLLAARAHLGGFFNALDHVRTSGRFADTGSVSAKAVWRLDFEVVFQ